jgi:hypothetical protein
MVIFKLKRKVLLLLLIEQKAATIKQVLEQMELSKRGK